MQAIVWIALATAPLPAAVRDTGGAIAVPQPTAPSLAPAPAETFARYQPHLRDTTARAIEHSNFYYTRLSIHRYASYATIPLFVSEYFLGQSLFNKQERGESTEGATRSAHAVVAGGLGVLFGVNTITGVWNLVESRKDPGGARRWIHAGLMLASDAGLAWAASLAPGDEGEGGSTLSDRRNKHRTVAVASMGVSLASYLMMLVWKD